MKTKLYTSVSALALCVALFTLGTSTPSRAATLRIAGQVINQSTSKPAVGASIEIVLAKEGSTPKPIKTVRSGVDGRFAFDLPNISSDDLLIARSTWSDHIYITPVYDAGGKLKSMGVAPQPGNLKLKVFDTTTAMVELQFTTHHLQVSQTDKGLKCVERFVVNNPSNYTYLGVGERQATLLLNLPAGAKNVKLDPQMTGAKLDKRPDGWAVMKPILPSSYSSRELVIINYDMEWPSTMPWGRKADFSRKIQYPTKFFFVVRSSEDAKLEVTSSKLGKVQTMPVPIDGTMESRLVNAVGSPMSEDTALKPGDNLDIEISSPVNPLFWGFLGFVVLLCIAVPVTLIKTSRSSGKIAEPSPNASVNERTLLPESAGALSTSVSLDQRSQELIEQIALLDNRFASGELARNEYDQQRSAKKKELLNLARTW